MRVLIAAVTAILVMASTVTAHAAHKRPHKRWVGNGAPHHHGKVSKPDASGWWPHDSNELAVGSQIWFEQMEREGRFGSRRGR